MEKILVSACLIGDNCTYLGGNNAQGYMEELNRYFDLVPVCPEQLGGLPTPRIPSEGRGGFVYDKEGKDVTSAFRLGAEKVAQLVSFLGIRLAILKERSPSCGVHQIHSGYFNNKLIDGEGVTTALLRSMGVRVLNEEEGKAFLEDYKKQLQIKDEKTRIAKAKEENKEEPKEEKRFEKPRKKEGSFEKKPFRKGDSFGKKPFKKEDSFGKKPFKKRFPKDGEKKPFSR